MKGKTKKALLAVTCVALVAVMTVAGTFAYLQDTSEDVVNTFKTNSVQVDLTESGDKNYDIIPGTTITKDPKVQATVTLPSYVFVEITDVVNAQGKKIVEYTIDSQWTALGDEYPNVYYREITESDKEAVSVLAGDIVTYPASLTNEDMVLLEDGKNTLSFKASAIQKEPFTSALQAWLAVPATIASSQEFTTALESGKSVVLTDDVTVDETINIPEAETPITVDFNGKNVDFNGEEGRLFKVTGQTELVINAEGSTVTIDNETAYGLVDVVAGAEADITVNGGNYINKQFVDGSLFKVRSGSTANITLNNVEATVVDRVISSDGTANIVVDSCKFTQTNEGVNNTGGTIPAVYFQGENNKITFKNTVITSEIGAAVEIAAATAEFDDCTFTVLYENTIQSWNGSAIAVNNKGQVTVNSGTYTSEQGYGLYIFNSCGKAVLNGGTFNGGVADVRADNGGTVEINNGVILTHNNTQTSGTGEITDNRE